MKKTNFLAIFIATALLIVTACDKTSTQKSTADGTGCKFNSKAELEKVTEADFDEDIFNTPASFSLDGPPIISQGATNKCVSFSSGYYITGMYNGLTSNSSSQDAAGSVEFMHAQYKKINNDDCAEGAFLFDEGGTVGMSEILAAYGTCKWGQLPFVESKACTVIPSNLTTEAAKNKIGGFERLDKATYSNTGELKAWLYAGFPLWFAVEADDAFQNLKGAEVWKSASGEASGHAMVIVGWDDAKNAFKIANSWGTDWADNGYGWVDYSYLKTLLAVEGSTIGVIYPNDNQRAVFNKLSPASCGNAGWGDLYIQNKRGEEIAVEMSGANNYTNNDAENIDANEQQSFSGIPKGNITVKVFDAKKTALIKEYTVTVAQCDDVVLTVD
jgi:Papain family cysteine protease